MTSWFWPEIDTGAWDGPKSDWENSHRFKYFEKVKRFGTVVQAGGCLGMYPRLLSEHFDTVYTFEPDPDNFSVLMMNCPSDRIKKFNSALGDTEERALLYRRRKDNLGMHSMIEDPLRDEDPPVEVVITTLDTLHLTECDLICLDVEGYEARVLLGAMETISRFSPVIVCENGNDTTYNLLQGLGYVEHDRSVSDTIYVPAS